MKTVTVTLPDSVFEEVSREANALHQSVSEVLEARLLFPPRSEVAGALRLTRQIELFAPTRKFSAENMSVRRDRTGLGINLKS
jgi:hypothetical protein